MSYIPKYCGKCGTKLVWKQDYAYKGVDMRTPYSYGKRFDKYDSETGEKQIMGWWECPKNRWWNWHDSFLPELLKPETQRGEQER